MATQLKYVKERNATEQDYAAFRCAGSIGCGERLTEDALAEHAAKQHNVYSYLQEEAGGHNMGVSVQESEGE